MKTSIFLIVGPREPAPISAEDRRASTGDKQRIFCRAPQGSRRLRREGLTPLRVKPRRKTIVCLANGDARRYSASCPTPLLAAPPPPRPHEVAVPGWPLKSRGASRAIVASGELDRQRCLHAFPNLLSRFEFPRHRATISLPDFA